MSSEIDKSVLKNYINFLMGKVDNKKIENLSSDSNKSIFNYFPPYWKINECKVCHFPVDWQQWTYGLICVKKKYREEGVGYNYRNVFSYFMEKQLATY